MKLLGELFFSYLHIFYFSKINMYYLPNFKCIFSKDMKLTISYFPEEKKCSDFSLISRL